MTYPYRIRYHLAQGSNFRKWKVIGPESTEFYDPATVTLVMGDCRLFNQRGSAEEVHRGEPKRVIAWVAAKRVEVLPATESAVLGLPVRELRYNPRVLPHWEVEGVDYDGARVSRIVSHGRQLFFTPYAQHCPAAHVPGLVCGICKGGLTPKPKPKRRHCGRCGTDLGPGGPCPTCVSVLGNTV